MDLLVRYRKPGGVTTGHSEGRIRPVVQRNTHNSPLTRTFENAAGHARGVYKAMKRHPGIRPDLVVAHSGFGSSLFLPYLYDCPVVNFFGVSSRVNGLCRGCDRRAGPLWSVLACGSRPVRIHQLTHVYCDIKKPFSRAWSSAPRVT